MRPEYLACAQKNVKGVGLPCHFWTLLALLAFMVEATAELRSGFWSFLVGCHARTGNQQVTQSTLYFEEARATSPEVGKR